MRRPHSGAEEWRRENRGTALIPGLLSVALGYGWDRPPYGGLQEPSGGCVQRTGQRPGNCRPTPPSALKRRHILCLLAAAFLATAAHSGTLEPKEAFEQLGAYDYGQELTPLVAIEALVDQSSNDAPQRKQITAQLAAILQEPKTSHAAKQFICRQLERIGTDGEVPILAKMLDGPQAGEFARRALQQIPGDAAAAALREALARTQGDARIGLINALGERRDPKAGDALSKLIADPDAKIARSAIRALGKLGTPEAATALSRAMEGAKSGLAEALCHAQLRCADALAAAGDTGAADAIYLPIYLRALGQKQPVIFRIAALSGLAKTRNGKAAPFLIESLSEPDPQLRGRAAGLAKQLAGRDFTLALVGQLRKADADGQVLLLGILTDRGDRSAATAVAKLAESPDERVRVAAVRSLGRVGDEASVDHLARLAAAPAGEVAEAARAALVKLAAAGADRRMVSLLGEAGRSEPKIALVLIQALVARGTGTASRTVRQVSVDGNQEVRIAALRALGALGGAGDYTWLVWRVSKAETEAECQAAEEAVYKVTGRMDPTVDRAETVIAALASLPPVVKGAPALLRILAREHTPKSLETVRAMVSRPEAALREAAIRILAEWPTDEVADDLLKLASGAENPTLRVLALRGYLRVARTTKRLELALPLVKATEEKLAWLAASGEVADPVALSLAARFLDDAQVRAEAILACLKIGDAVVGTDPNAVKTAMQKVLDSRPEKSIADHAQALLEGKRGSLPLFDGRTLKGWASNGVGNWSVEDGALVGNGTRGQGYGLLFSERQYKDFTLHFRYKVLAGNAGFYIRAEKLAGSNGVRGLQVEIDPVKDNGGLFEVGGRDWVAKPDPKLPRDYFRPRDWNDVTVVAQGRHLTVTMNGHKTVDLPNDPGRTEGFFAVGMHGGGVHVIFKDIEVLAPP